MSSYEPISDASEHFHMWHLRLILMCPVFSGIIEKTAGSPVSEKFYFPHLQESNVWVREMRSSQHAYLGRMQVTEVRVPGFGQAM